MNADLNARVVLDTDAMAWLATDGARDGCKLLDRVDTEGTQATSVVRCAPGCALDMAGQGLGEEILVLEGTLMEGRAGYSAGTYLRYPPVSFSEDDCTNCQESITLHRRERKLPGSVRAKSACVPSPLCKSLHSSGEASCTAMTCPLQPYQSVGERSKGLQVN